MGTYATRALYPNLTRISQLGTYNDKYPPHHRVSMFGAVAGKRRVFEFRSGAGRVPDPAEPRPGWGDGGVCLGRMHLLGVACGIVLLLARLARTRTFASFVTPVALCVVLMIAFTIASQVGISPRMTMLRVQMGSIQATAQDSPLLAEFARLHRISVSLESGVLLAGFAAIYLMVRETGIAH